MTAIRKDKDSPEFIDVYLTESKAFLLQGSIQALKSPWINLNSVL